MKPGIYPDLPMAEYLSIDALSQTPVRYLIDECARAGWWHSRLNPQRPREVSEQMDIGTIAHSVLLENSWDCVVKIDPADYPAKNGNVPKGWTNEAIREARDAARAAGKCPILIDEIEPIEDMVIVVRAFIMSLQHTEPAIWRAFEPDGGKSELTMVWDDGGTLCKLRTDRISNDYAVVIDYKTGGMSVEPDRYGRTQLADKAFGAAWYRRGIRALTGVDASYIFLCQEVDPPHLCALIGLDPSWLAMGSAKVAAGLRMWQQCVRTGQFDGYPNRVCYPALPAWESARFEEKLIGNPYKIEDLFERTDKK